MISNDTIAETPNFRAIPVQQIEYFAPKGDLTLQVSKGGDGVPEDIIVQCGTKKLQLDTLLDDDEIRHRLRDRPSISYSAAVGELSKRKEDDKFTAEFMAVLNTEGEPVAPALYALAGELFQAGDFASAATLSAFLVSCGVSDPRPAALAGSAYYEMGETAKAQTYLSRAAFVSRKSDEFASIRRFVQRSLLRQRFGDTKRRTGKGTRLSRV